MRRLSTSHSPSVLGRSVRSIRGGLFQSVPVIALALVLLVSGCAEPAAESGGQLHELWVSDTTSDIGGNHHAIAAGRIEDEGMVYIPIGGRAGQKGCALVAVNSSGVEQWRHEVPPGNCTIHAVADPTIADFDGDGTPEVLATTTERTVFAFHPLTGETTFRANLSAYGYTHPILADATGDGDPELVVSDVDGTLYVRRPSGEILWRRTLGSYTWAHPAVGDFDDDGTPEIVTALGNGSILAFDSDGSVLWRHDGLGPITWMTSRGGHDHDVAGQDGHSDHHADGGDQGVTPDIVVATTTGDVVALDGETGHPIWDRGFGELAAVRAYEDGDGDGAVEVYAVAKDATLRAVDGESGETEWSTPLTDRTVQMTPPPTIGDVDGDTSPEIVAVTNDGWVGIVDPTDGSILATYERRQSIYSPVTLADTDGDGAAEIYVMYGDGKAVALRYGE